MGVAVLCLVFASAYRPANIFLRKRASRPEIQQQFHSLTKYLHNSTNATIKRRFAVHNDAEDIIFDAIAGSRTGSIARERAVKRISWYVENYAAFERDLFKAQVSVGGCQLLYSGLQSLGFIIIFKVVADIADTF
jgi:hypothetical protein